MVVGGSKVFLAAGGAERKVVRPEREAAYDNAAGYVTRREVVVETDGGDLVDEVHRDHLGDEGEVNGVGRFAREGLGGDLVFRLKAAERRKNGGLLAGGGGVSDEEAGGFVRASEGERALGDGDGEDAFTLAAVGAEFEKFRLEAEELLVERDFAIANVARMEVADVAVGVTVARLENDAVVAVADNDMEEYLALAVETCGGAVAIVALRTSIWKARPRWSLRVTRNFPSW